MRSGLKAQALTIPNGLSALRLLLVPFAAVLLAGGQHDVLAVCLLAAAGISDWLDGFLARKLNQVSELGILLDPLADRVAIIAFVFALAARHSFPWWIVAIVLGRDVMLLMWLPALRKRGRWAMPVTFVGKMGTAVLFAGFPLALIGTLTPEHPAWRMLAITLLCAGALIYWVAGVSYIRAIRSLDARP
jgi:cardiolipin synthase